MKVARALRGGRELRAAGELSCCDCGASFRLSDDHLAWFVQRDLPPPRRCERCRAARRGSTR